MKKNKTKSIVIIGTIAVLAISGIYALVSYNSKPGKLDDFAKCLEEKGAVFYGAFWCPHCQEQKEMFGKSAKYVPYVECSTVDGNNQLPVCKNQNIDGYPTWIFADESRESGKLTLSRLAEKTSCQLPN